MSDKELTWFFNGFLAFACGWSGILLVEHGEGLSGELTIFLGLVFFAGAAESQNEELKLMDSDYWVPSNMSKLLIFFLVGTIAWLFNVSRLLALYHEYGWSIITWMLALLLSTIVARHLKDGGQDN